MNPTIKRYVLSSATTFLTSFFGVLAMQLAGGVPADVTGTFVLGLITVAVRAGIKALVESAAGQHADPAQNV